MILNSQRNTSPLPSRARVAALTLGAVMLALAGLRIGPRIALGETPGAVPASNPIGSANSGPVLKDAPTPLAIPVPPAAAVVPDLVPVPAAPPTPAALALPPAQDRAPQAVERDPLAPVSSASENLEQRLDRLEKLVQELVSRNVLISDGKSGNHHARVSNDAFKPEVFTVEPDGKVKTLRMMGPTDEDARRLEVDAKQLEKQIRKEAELARREAMKEAEQARKEALEQAEEARREADEAKLEALREREEAAEEQHRELEEQRRALVEEQAELKRRMAEIDQELAKLKASNDNKNADRK